MYIRDIESSKRRMWIRDSCDESIDKITTKIYTEMFKRDIKVEDKIESGDHIRMKNNRKRVGTFIAQHPHHPFNVVEFDDCGIILVGLCDIEKVGETKCPTQ